MPRRCWPCTGVEELYIVVGRLCSCVLVIIRIIACGGDGGGVRARVRRAGRSTPASDDSVRRVWLACGARRCFGSLTRDLAQLLPLPCTLVLLSLMRCRCGAGTFDVVCCGCWLILTRRAVTVE